MTAPPSAQCVPSTWTDPSSTTGDSPACQSAHFAIHAPVGTISAQQWADATTELENVNWLMRFGCPMQGHVDSAIVSESAVDCNEAPPYAWRP
jgi:hypothetical protein